MGNCIGCIEPASCHNCGSANISLIVNNGIFCSLYCLETYEEQIRKLKSKKTYSQ